MFNTNRRHTEALEKSASALKRLAAAEETIARNIGELLGDDDDPAAVPPHASKKDPPPKKNQPSKD